MNQQGCTQNIHIKRFLCLENHITKNYNIPHTLNIAIYRESQNNILVQYTKKDDPNIPQQENVLHNWNKKYREIDIFLKAI